MEKKLLVKLRSVVICGYTDSMETNTNTKPVKYQNGYMYRGVVIHRSARHTGQFISIREQYAAGLLQGLTTAKHLGTLAKIVKGIDNDIDVLNCLVLRGKTWTQQAIEARNRGK